MDKSSRLIILIITTILLLMPQKGISGNDTDTPFEIKWSGFIMNNFFYDSRQMSQALDGLVTIFPLPPNLDQNGTDINSSPNAGFFSFATRLRTNISGPELFGAKTTAYVEFDFTGRSNTAALRYRQGWVNLNWGSTNLLLGRAWTPMVSMDVVPQVVGMNIGVPFSPFNRSDQITLTQNRGRVDFILSALYQNDYMNNGPEGRSAKYQNNAVIPNLHFQIKYRCETKIFGLGIDYKKLKPRQFTESPITGAKYSAVNQIGMPALLAYGKYFRENFSISAKTIYAANTSENIMPGAFGIKSYDPLTGKEEYAPYKHWFLWGNLTYGTTLKAGLFGGYLKNLGASDNIIAPSANLPVTVFGFGETIADMYRISPSLSYSKGNVMIGAEVERSVATYGEIDYSNMGKIKNGTKIKSTRLLLTLYYHFN